MMLLSLALIRHSVLSLSEGLPKKESCSHRLKNKRNIELICFSLEDSDASLLTCRQTWEVSLAVLSPSPSWRSTR